MSVVVKVIFAHVFATVVGLSAWGGSTLRSKLTSSLETKLLSDGKIPIYFLSRSQKEQWEGVYEDSAYKTDIQSTLGLASTVNKDEGARKLMEWCLFRMFVKHRSLSQDILEKIYKWCLVTSVSKEAIRKGKTILQDSDSEWESQYDTNKSSLSNIQVTTSEKNSDIDTTKKWCKQRANQAFLYKEKTVLYDNFVKFCTKASDGGAAGAVA